MESIVIGPKGHVPTDDIHTGPEQIRFALDAIYDDEYLMGTMWLVNPAIVVPNWNQPEAGFRCELDGKALTTAESAAGGGKLTITRWRAGKTEEVAVKLPVLGSYGMMNSPGVPLTISLVMARAAGVKDPALDRAGLRNQDGRARGAIGSVYRNLSTEEIMPLLPAIYQAIVEPAPSSEMFADEMGP